MCQQFYTTCLSTGNRPDGRSFALAMGGYATLSVASYPQGFKASLDLPLNVVRFVRNLHAWSAGAPKHATHFCRQVPLGTLLSIT
jgi:hypothetical protein